MVDSPDAFTALAHPARRKILALVREQAMSAGEIAGHFDLARPTLSGHFNILKAADLISAERRGTSLIYAANLSVLEDALFGLIKMMKLGEMHDRRILQSPPQ